MESQYENVSYKSDYIRRDFCFHKERVNLGSELLTAMCSPTISKVFEAFIQK